MVHATESGTATTYYFQRNLLGEVEEAESAFHVAVEEECPLTLCVAYIRDHVAALTGTEEPAAEATLPEDTADGE